MTLKVNKDITGPENLLELIKYSFPIHASKFTADTVTISEPSLHADGIQSSKVIISAVPGQGLTGTKEVYFTRFELVDVNVVVDELPTDALGVTAALAAHFEDASYLTNEVTVGEVVPGDGIATVTLTAPEGGYTVTGSSEVTFTLPDVDMEDILGEGELDGFDHTPA